MLRHVLSAVCVASLAPVVPAGARPCDDPHNTASPMGACERPSSRGVVLVLGTRTPTSPPPSARVDAPRDVTIQIPDDRESQEPQVVVVERPTITCPMVVIAADPGIDPKFVAAPPKDMTFTIRSVAPPVCR